MTDTTTTAPLNYDPYSWTLHQADGTSQEMHTALPAPDLVVQWVYQANELQFHTGLRPALMTDGGHYMGLHLLGNGHYSVLCDEMGGQPAMTVLETVPGHTWEYRVLYRLEASSWQRLAEMAASVRLGN